jgi:starch phosphorylase
MPRRVSNPIDDLLPFEVEGFAALAELALDVRWSSGRLADDVWRQLDPNLWDLTHNPWGLLQTVARDRIEQLWASPAFRGRVDSLVRAKRLEAAALGWFQRAHPASPLSQVAYFSMEFMLSEALAIYSGGLGNVAGDQLNAASDLGIPVVGVGLLYQQGYFRQMIDQSGRQQALFPHNDPGQMPITPVREANGEWLRLSLEFPGYPVTLRAWQVQVGRARLYLLDSNDLANVPAKRGITSELYGGGPEQRIQQEIVLGIGGWRLLQALGIHPDVCHLNEGHAAFAVLERAASFMTATGHRFDVALATTRAGNLFTTHTAVPAGFDVFPPALVEQYLGDYAAKRLGISFDDLVRLGRRNPADTAEGFNLAYLAIGGSGSVNAVSRLHGQVSRRLFSPLFPRWPEAEVPVGYVTNGVHTPTWESAEAATLWGEVAGKDRWQDITEAHERNVRHVSDAQLWTMRQRARASLVDDVRARLSRSLAIAGAPAESIAGAKQAFNPDVLTLGFARRFATYKRPNLLLHDPERLRRLLTNPDRPVQLFLAGKAHPADQAGQEMIAAWNQFIRDSGTDQHVAFLADYDMRLTECLVQGVDVWLNTPRRPWEASGTSGMKVLVNGGLNCSELDGWWAEAYTPEVGWALGDGREHGDDPAWDAAEAETLYDLLEREIIPAFYTRGASGIPTAWVARIRESMARLTPRFSTNRVLREYVEAHYLPAATEYHRRAADNGAVGQQISAWQHALERQWDAVCFGELTVQTTDGQHQFSVEVSLGDLDPEAVRVELYADGIGDTASVREEMARAAPVAGSANASVYRATVSAARASSDYTPRVIPRFDGAAIPLEAAWVCWQR